METLDEQVGRWLRQAEHDLETARKLMGLEAFDHASFLAQQASEKVLKACWMLRHGQSPPRTHDLVRLATELSAPSAVVEAARLMAGDYMATRYPDISEEIPAETYSSDDAKERVAAADVLFCWARGILQ